MKKKSSKGRAAKILHEAESDADESQSSHSGENGKQNGDFPSAPVEPKEKKRKNKGKNVSSDEDDDQPQKKKKKSGKGRKAKDSEASDGEDESVVEEANEEPDEKKKKKSGKGRKPKDSEATDGDDESVDEADDEPKLEKKSSSKRKPGRGRKSNNAEEVENAENNEEDDDEPEYEVDKIIDEKIIRGQRHYLIRWKGYEEDSDTWEPEATLNCPEAMEDYKKTNKKAAPVKGLKKIDKKNKKTPEPEERWDENENFEVVRILDVHFKRDGKRDFLVAWKGYPNSYNSWEPEENMNCKDLIERFLKKCNDAKEASQKDLRVNRKTTDRFTLSTSEQGRRLSKRTQGKQRVQYHDAE